MGFTFWFAVAFYAVIVVTAMAAEKPTRCDTHEKWTAWLSEDWSERPAFAGLVNSQQAVEVWMSPAGSWTILHRTLGGPTCAMVTGASGRIREIKPEDM